MKEKVKVVTIEGVDYVTVSDVSNELKISRQRVHQLLQDERFEGAFKDDTPRGAVWYIPYPLKIELPLRQRNIANV
tara:strand:- start:870 stop:1097 length:228 start_codon:yes stop_codon:yes gene_type:complete